MRKLLFFLTSLMVGFFLVGNPLNSASSTRAAIGPTPTPTQLVPRLINSKPTNREILEFLWTLHNIKQEPYHLQDGRNTEIERIEQDVNGDGQKDIIALGVHHYETAFLAVLTFHVQRGWQEIGFIEDSGHYCLDSRATIQNTRIVFDVYGCSGGTGVRNGTWTQHWLQCAKDTCAVVWNGEMLFFQRTYNWDWRADFRVSQIEQPTRNRIVRTTERFGFEQIPMVGIADDIPSMPHRLMGPKTQQVFEWDGTTFALVSENELDVGLEISGEFHQASRGAAEFLNQQIVKYMANENGIAPANTLATGLEKFWGIADAKNTIWKKSYLYFWANAARVNSDKSKLAAILGNVWNNRCELVTQRLGEKHFELIGRVEVSCVPSFTHIDWLDIDQDGNQELLLLTLANEREDDAGMQRLRIYRADTRLEELAALVGDVNGADGVGVRWEQEPNAFKIYAGITPHFTGNSSKHDCLTLSCVFTDRRWKTYRWDKTTNTLIEEK